MGKAFPTVIGQHIKIHQNDVVLGCDVTLQDWYIYVAYTWLGCKALGPLTFLDFSNCGEIFVMYPYAAMKDSLETICYNWIFSFFYRLWTDIFINKGVELTQIKYSRKREIITCVTPVLSILNRLTFQFPVERLRSKPLVISSFTIHCIKK